MVLTLVNWSGWAFDDPAYISLLQTRLSPWLKQGAHEEQKSWKLQCVRHRCLHSLDSMTFCRQLSCSATHSGTLL